MFRNARFFRLDADFSIDAQRLEEALAGRRFRSCGPLEAATMGWTQPLGEEGQVLAHGVAGCLLVCARKQERLVPSAALSEALDERVAEIEAGEARAVGRSERRRLREQILAEMMPRAFTRSRRTLAYLDTQTNWLVVDAASDRRAEELVSLLRETLGSLPAKSPAPGSSPEALMTRWLLEGDAPHDFVPADACELRDAREGSVVRVSGQDLGSEEILTHLRAGKQATRLALEWAERLRLVLGSDLGLTRIQLADALLDELDDGEDPAARLDAELALIALELRELIIRLTQLFGLDEQGDRPASAAA